MSREKNILEAVRKWAKEPIADMSGHNRAVHAFWLGYEEAMGDLLEVLDEFAETVGKKRRPYVIDYETDEDGDKCFCVLKRKRDEEVLYRDEDPDAVRLQCWELGIGRDEVEIISR